MAGSGRDKNADEEPANGDDGREKSRSKKRKLQIDGSSPDVYDVLMLMTRSVVCAGRADWGVRDEDAGKRGSKAEEAARVGGKAGGAGSGGGEEAGGGGEAAGGGGKNRGKKRGKQPHLSHNQRREQHRGRE